MSASATTGTRQRTDGRLKSGAGCAGAMTTSSGLFSRSTAAAVPGKARHGGLCCSCVHRLRAMARELERAVIALIRRLLGASLADTPTWLVRPGRAECGGHWELARSIYRDLTDLELPEEMRRIERRTVDAVLVSPDATRILEIDEKQHFNVFRALTLKHYVDRVPLAFDARRFAWRTSRSRTGSVRLMRRSECPRSLTSAWP